MTVRYPFFMLCVGILYLLPASAKAQFKLFDELTVAVSSNTLGGKERFAGYQLGFNSRLPTKGGREDRPQRINFTTTTRLTWRKFRPLNLGLDPANVTAFEFGIGPEFATSGPFRAGIKALLAVPLASEESGGFRYQKIFPGLTYEAFFAFTPRFMLGLEGTIITGPVGRLQTNNSGPAQGNFTLDYNIRWLAVGTRVRLH